MSLPCYAVSWVGIGLIWLLPSVLAGVRNPHLLNSYLQIYLKFKYTVSQNTIQASQAILEVVQELSDSGFE